MSLGTEIGGPWRFARAVADNDNAAMAAVDDAAADTLADSSVLSVCASAMPPWCCVAQTDTTDKAGSYSAR